MAAEFTRGDDFTLSAHITNMSFSWENVTDVRVSLKQGDYVAIKTMKHGDVEVDDDNSTITFSLSHEETLPLSPGRLRMQLTFLIDDKYWTDPTIMQIKVNNLLDDGVISDG